MPIINSASEIIETERLLLRKFTINDIDHMLKNWISDNDVQSRYGEPVFTERHAVKELLDKWSSQYRWAIILKESNENIGHVSLCRLYREANTAEIEYSFKNTSIIKLEAFHRIENPASGMVLKKVGMKVVKAPDGDICYAIIKA